MAVDVPAGGLVEAVLHSLAHGPVGEIGDVGTDFAEHAGRTSRPHAEDLVVAMAVAGQEADLGVEVLADIAHGGVGREAPAAPRGGDVPGGVGPLQLRGVGSGHEGSQRQLVADADAAVDGVGPVVVAGETAGAVHEEAADTGTVGEFLRDARDRVRVLGIPHLVGAGLDVQQAQIQACHAPGEPAAARDGDRLAAGDADAAAEEEVGAPCPDGEEARVLEEERALLGKQQREAGQVDLLVVDLDLREVGVHRHVQGEALGDLHLGLAPELGLSSEPGLRRVGVVPGRGSQHVGRDGGGSAERRFDPRQLAREVEPVEPELAGNGRPEVLFVEAADPARDVEAPRVGFGPVAQRAERDAEFGVPALGVAGCGDRPAAVPVLVEAAPGTPLETALPGHAPAEEEPAAAALGGDLAVVLDPGGRGAEDEAVLLVVVGVEDHDHGIGIGDFVVADGLTRDDGVRLGVVGPHGDVDGILVEEDAEFGGFGSGLAVGRLALGEVGEGRGGCPDRVVGDAIDDGRGVGAGGNGNSGRGSVGGPAVAVRRGLLGVRTRRAAGGTGRNGCQEAGSHGDQDPVWRESMRRCDE